MKFIALEAVLRLTILLFAQEVLEKPGRPYQLRFLTLLGMPN
jgi:hypothetical protein